MIIEKDNIIFSSVVNDFKVRSKIEIHGYTCDGPYGFFAIQFMNSNDSALHFSAKTAKHENEITINSKVNGIWQKEEKYENLYFKQDQYFHLKITTKKKYFKIQVNGHHLCNFQHRLPTNMVNMIKIKNDVQLHKIKFQNVQPKCAKIETVATKLNGSSDIHLINNMTNHRRENGNLPLDKSTKNSLQNDTPKSNLILNDYSHGYVVIPMLLEANQSGLLNFLQSEKTTTLETACHKLCLHLGYADTLSSTLESLELISRDGKSIYWVDHLNLYKDIQQFPKDLLKLYGVNPLEYIQTSSISQWKEFLHISNQRWPCIESEVFKNFLDGVLIVPLVVALYRHTNGKLYKDNMISLKGVSESVKPEIFLLFQSFKWGYPTEAGTSLALTDLGLWVYKQALNSALGLSYRPLLNELHSLMIGNIKQVFQHTPDGYEGHVDRSLNVLSSGSMHRSYFKVMIDSILAIFDNKNFEEQPFYIVDTGCGDGTLLATIYQTIRQQSKRGHNLEQYPLLMIGVDYNKAALQETTKTLSSLSIPHMVLHGDIGDPASIIQDLCKNGIDQTKGLLHVRSFLDHDRPFKLSNETFSIQIPTTNTYMYTTQDGEVFSSDEVIQSLIEHLDRWVKILSKNADLMILEVHNMSPRNAFAHRQHSISLHFDPLQAFSGQFLVPAKTFVSCAAAVGLIPEQITNFPDDKPFTRITFNHFRQQNYRIYCINKKHEADLMNLAQINKTWDMDGFKEWLTIQLEQHPTSHFVLEELNQNGSYQVKAALYTTKVSSLDKVPRNLLETHVDDDLSHSYVHILDIHTEPVKQKEYRRKLMKYILQLSLLSENVQEVSYLTRALPSKQDSKFSSLENLLANSDEEIIEFNEYPLNEEQVVPACQGYKRLLLKYTLRAPTEVASSLNSIQINKETIFNWIRDEVKQILNEPILINMQTSLLALGLDSLELSMLVRYLNTKLQKTLALHTVFRYPRVGQLVEFILRQQKLDEKPIVRQEKSEICQKLPLSLAQEVMWVWYELVGDTSAYNVPRIEHLIGPLSIQALDKAIRLIANRHLILRTRYEVEKGVPKQMVVPMEDFITPLEILDLRRHNQKMYSKAKKAIVEEINKPIDLVQGSAFRIRLLQLQEKEHVLIITMHHMVTDGSSIPIFWNELTIAYNSYIENQEPQCKPLKCQYFDWAKQQRELFENGQMQGSINFWMKKLRGELPVLDLPTDYPYPEMQTFNGNRLSLQINSDANLKLKSICANSDSTLFMAIVAAWGAFLCRHTRQDEIVIGTPWANRDTENIQNLIGCFVNTLPLRIDYTGNPTFKQLIERVKQEILEAFEHANIPFHKMVEAIKLPSTKRLPVYQTMVALEEENGWVRGNALAKTKRAKEEDRLYSIRNTSKFEISLSLREKDNCLMEEFVYNTDIFSQRTAELMKERFILFCNELIEKPEVSYRELNIIPNIEEQHLLVDLNRTQLCLPENTTVLDLIEEQVKKTPNSIAISWHNVEFTYQQLWQRVQQISEMLVEQEVKHGDHVGLLFERTPDLLIALLASIQIGAVYVALDPNYPEERLKYIIKDANIQKILTHQLCIEQASQLEVGLIFVDQNNSLAQTKNLIAIKKSLQSDIVYILYTSGTTGKPKGAKITHRNLLNDIWYMIKQQIPIEDFCSTLFTTNVCFDQCVEEIFPPLCTGGTIVLEESALNRTWRKQNITFMVMTPSVMSYVLKDGIPSTVRSLVLGGEGLSQKLVDEIFALTNIQTIFNSYGPTECTDQSTVCILTRDKRNVTLGRPIANTLVYILDACQNLVPHGVWGELCIGGEGVGEGYLNREDLTKEKFIQNPFGKGRIYRTGDVARWNADGQLEFLGRSDDQIKINGVRIEKKEIEETILTFQGVHHTHVTVFKNNASQECLVAYLTPDTINSREVEIHCRNLLPMHMVPDKIVVLSTVPLTVSGKIDVKALPNPYKLKEDEEEKTVEHIQMTRGSKDPMIESIITAYEDLLQTQIDENTSFFAAGGHSLLAVQVLGRIQELFGIRLKMREFFEYNNPRALANILRPNLELSKTNQKVCENKIETKQCVQDLLPVPSGGSHILIIGAGIAGIMAAIECKRRNLPFLIVEKADSFGGIWLHGCNNESKLQTTSHVYTIDPSIAHKSQYPYKKEVLEYLSKVAELHNLEEKTLFNHIVEEIQHSEQGFGVLINDLKTGTPKTLNFDGILVCTGKHHVPNIPKWPVVGDRPQTVHASRLEGTDLKDQDVVIVGGGSYAIEALRIAHQRQAKSITLIARRSHWILPTFADTILYSEIGKNDLTISPKYQGLTKNLENWLEEYYRLHGIEHMIPSPENRAFDAYISTSDEFFQIAETKSVRLRIGEIQHLVQNGVVLNDQTFIESNIIIAATGYKDPAFTFLKPIVGENVEIYKGFMLKNDPRIGFVGFLDMVFSATAVIPINLDLCLKVMQDPYYRPNSERVNKWITGMPQDLVNNVKSHVSWLIEEKAHLDEVKDKNELRLERLVDVQAKVNSSNIAIIESERGVTYGEMIKMVDSLATYFIESKAKVIVSYLPQSIESIIAFLAAFKAGSRMFCFNTKLEFAQVFERIKDEKLDLFITTKHQMEFIDQQNPIFMEKVHSIIIVDANADLYCTPSKVMIPLETIYKTTSEIPALDLREIESSKTACIFFTSGSTGKPKGVQHSYGSLAKAVQGFDTTLSGATPQPHRLILVNGITHIGGFMTAFAVLYRGGTLILRESFNKENYISDLNKFKPTLIVLMCSWLMEILDNISLENDCWLSIRRIVVGGENLQDVLPQKLSRFTCLPLTVTFGISECGPLFRNEDATQNYNELGIPLKGVEFKVVKEDGSSAQNGEIGELLIKSPAIFKGYQRQPALTQESFSKDRWFKTKDFVQVKLQDKILYKGREKDRLQGKLFVQDLEKLLIQHKGIQGAAVLHDYKIKPNFIQIIAVPVAGYDLSKESVLKHVFANFPDLDSTLDVQFKCELPKNSTGKIDRKLIFPINSFPTRPKVLLFPGQGIQYVGMAKEAYEKSNAVQKLFRQAENIVGYNIYKICTEGPKELLDKTDVAQVAIFLACLAELIIIQEEDPYFLINSKYMAGLSLGEYTALVAAGAISFEDAVKFLHLRGQSMQSASELSPQGMINIMNVSRDKLLELIKLCQKYGRIFLANDLNPTHAVVAGEKECCKIMLDLVEKIDGIAFPLKVSGAFHTPFMEPAAQQLRAVLSQLEIHEPRVPIICNFDGKPTSDPNYLRTNLINQIDHPVQFSGSLKYLIGKEMELKDFHEVGPNKKLIGIVQQFIQQTQIGNNT